MDFSAVPDDSAITDCRDRLSELPDSLILSILSLLETRDAVMTTFLSKRWKDLWTTVPCLDFWIVSCNFVCGTLAKWKGAKIHKIFLRGDDPPTSDIVDSLLLLAVEKQVEELYIYLGPHFNNEVRTIQRLYSCSSITKLFLGYFTLKVEERVQWNQLKSLTIEDMNSFREHDMNQILCGSPLLEELVFWSLYSRENLNILSNSLKKLEIGRYDCTCTSSVVDEELRICCPNLLSLEISACVYGTCLLEVPSCTDVILCFKESCNIIFGEVTDKDFPPLEMFHQVSRDICHIEKVTLSDLCVKLLLNMNANDMSLEFPNTKFLKLYAGEPQEMLDVIRMFPQLKTLIIELDEDCKYALEYEKYAFRSFKNQATFPGLSLLQLKTVEIIWSERDASIFTAIEILLENAHFLEKMVFRPHGSYFRELWLKAKKEGAKYEEILSKCRGRRTILVSLFLIWHALAFDIENACSYFQIVISVVMEKSQKIAPQLR